LVWAYGPIQEWDVSEVKDMAGLFAQSLFNDDISDWNVGKVTSMSVSNFNFHSNKFVL